MILYLERGNLIGKAVWSSVTYVENKSVYSKKKNDLTSKLQRVPSRLDKN